MARVPAALHLFTVGAHRTMADPESRAFICRLCSECSQQPGSSVSRLAAITLKHRGLRQSQPQASEGVGRALVRSGHRRHQRNDALGMCDPLGRPVRSWSINGQSHESERHGSMRSSIRPDLEIGYQAPIAIDQRELLRVELGAAGDESSRQGGRATQRPGGQHDRVTLMRDDAGLDAGHVPEAGTHSTPQHRPQHPYGHSAVGNECLEAGAVPDHVSTWIAGNREPPDTVVARRRAGVRGPGARQPIRDTFQHRSVRNAQRGARPICGQRYLESMSPGEAQRPGIVATAGYHQTMDTVTLASRLLLAAIFAAAAVTKLSNPAVSRATFDGFGASPRLARLGAFTLAPCELLVAAALIFVPTARWGGAGAALLLLVFILGIASALRHGRRPDCGCFGALRPTPIGTSTLVRNAALLAVAVFVVVAAPGPAIDAWLRAHSAAEVVITCAAIAAALAAVMYLPQLVDGAPHSIMPGSAAMLAIGKRAPSFTLTDTQGAHRTSQSLSAPGSPLVLIFGSPTCGSCVKLFPSLARWQRSLAGRLQLVLIVGGDIDAARAISEQHGIAEVLSDPGGGVSRSHGVIGNPSAVSLTPDGRVASGPALGPDAIEELLRSTLRRTEPIPIPWLQTINAA